jgi:hypothetical protein
MFVRLTPSYNKLPRLVSAHAGKSKREDFGTAPLDKNFSTLSDLSLGSWVNKKVEIILAKNPTASLK